MSAITPTTGDWTPEELERHGSAALHRICRHLGSLDELDVTTDLDPRAVIAAIDAPIPIEGENFETILDDTWDHVVPALTQWNHPRFHGYFSNSSSGPAMLAELTAAAVNVNVMLWDSAPGAAAVEHTVTRWLADMLDYPAADALLVDGASLGTFYALAAARHRAQPDVRQRGTTHQGMPRIYTSDQAHSSIDKAAIALGVGLDNVVRIPTDPTDPVLDPDALDARITADITAGMTPIAVVATVGTTTSGALDPIDAIAQVCQRHGVWLHVDAAYGGFWRLAPTITHRIPSLAQADSLVANPHKVLYTPMECGALFCRHPGALEEAFTLVPDYLRTPHDDNGIDYMNFTLSLGRQFRALKLWWTLRSFGVRGIASRLQHTLALADHLRALIAADPRWRVVNDSPLPLLCLRLTDAAAGGDADTATREVIEFVNATHRTLLSHSVLDGKYVIRVSLGNIHTTALHVEKLMAGLAAATTHVIVTGTDDATTTAKQEVSAL